MAIPYPDWLSLPQKANKSRTIDAGFRTDQPAVGAPIFQRLTDDLKTTWSLTWIFTLQEDRAFEQWYRSPRYLDNGNQWFTMLCNLGALACNCRNCISWRRRFKRASTATRRRGRRA